MPAVQPTTGQLVAAFAAERKPHWPADYWAAMADPLYHRIVVLHAKLLALGRDPGAYKRVIQRPQVIAPEPPHPAEPPAPCPARPQRPAKPRRAAPPPPDWQLPLLDRKRAAAGDTD